MIEIWQEEGFKLKKVKLLKVVHRLKMNMYSQPNMLTRNGISLEPTCF